jgi:hypothetical protein
VQVAVPGEDTGTAGQSLIEFPLMVKVTVPLGAGDGPALCSVAVNVTDVPTLTEVEGEADKVSVGATACVTLKGELLAVRLMESVRATVAVSSSPNSAGVMFKVLNVASPAVGPVVVDVLAVVRDRLTYY